MMVNKGKTDIIHFRQRNEPRSDFKFYYGEFVLQTVDKYKYLGCVLDEFLDFTCTMGILAESSTRALGAVINKCLKQSNLS